MIPIQHALWTVLAGVFGALFGSFLNVVVYRLPLGLSVVRPASRCGACGKPIAPWHNLPVLSWVLLRGRAACCGAPFSIRYPMVEAASAGLAVALWVRFSAPTSGGALPELGLALSAWALTFAFACVLLAVALIDLDTLRIPDILSLPLLPLGLLAAWAVGPTLHVTVEQSLLGLLIGGGTLLVITYGYFALTGREGMGLGDYRLMAGVGAWLGWQSLLFLLMASAIQGLLFAAVVKLLRLEGHLPGLDDPDPVGFQDPAAAQPRTEGAGLEGAGVERAGVEGAGVEDPAAPVAPGTPGEPGPQTAAPAEPQGPDVSSAGARPGPAPLAVPFGPFIALAAVEWLLFEGPLMKLLNGWIYIGIGP